MATSTVSERFLTEVVGPLAGREARDEAERCFYCYEAPCIRGCPTHIDVPVFIHQIATGDVAAAARTILASNILGASCARICPTEALCEGACVRRAERPVSIGRLQRYATDHVMAHGMPGLPRLPERAIGGRTVAVVGAGPAGLGAAATLARMGYPVTVYDARERGGGLDTYGIVDYREPTPVSLAEVEWVASLGVRFQFGVQVGADVTWEDLRREYDAVVMAIGLGGVPSLHIPGEDLPGVWDALDLVEATKTGPPDAVSIGARVAVIGAGNTAVDAATCAKRLGAEDVTIYYRRGEAAMPAYAYEYTFAKQEGIQYRWWTTPVAIVGQGRVEGLRVVRTRPVEPASAARRDAVLESVPGTEVTVSVDAVIRAIGQDKRREAFQSVGVAIVAGRVQVDPDTYETTVSGVYAVGDALARPGEATVVQAVEDGKQAAFAIHRKFASPPAASASEQGRQ